MGFAKNRCALGRAAIFCLILGPGGPGACKKSLRAGARNDFLFIFGAQGHLVFCVCDGGEGGGLTLTPQTIIEQ